MAQKIQEKLPKEVTRTAWILVVSAIAPMLDSTMVNIAINKLQSDLNTSLNMIQWAITGYVLALAVAVPVCGYLVNHFNGKIVMQWSTIAFGVFSFLSGQAWNIQTFIAFRAIQGFAAGFITLLMTTLLMQVAPKGRFGELVAIISTPIILGPILGPVLGGFIVQDTNWHWLFFVNVPVCALAVALNALFLPNFEPMNSESKLDWFGTILLTLGSIGLIYGIMQGSENAKNFFNQQMLIFTGLGLIAFVSYGVYNGWRHDETVLPLRFFKIRNFTAANIGIFLAGIASNGPMLLLPLFFQNTKGFTATQAALMLVPQGLGMLIARPTIGKLIDRLGARPVVLVSLAISFVGTVPFIFVSQETSLVWLGIVLLVRGIGIGGLQMPMMTDIFIGLDKKDIASASVGQRIIQNIGSSFGSAVISAVVTAVVTSEITGQMSAKLHQLTAAHTILTPTVVASVKKGVEASVTLNGYQIGFLVSSVFLMLIAIPSFFLSSRKS